MEAVNGVSEGDKGGPPPPSPLTGCYLLIVIGEPHCNEHKDIILQRVAKGLLSWDVNDCLVDLEKELAIITEQALEGEEARYGERLIQFASENLVTEILIHPVVSTLAQCVRNLLSSFTRHRHIIHAGYTFANNGSWTLQDGTFSSVDFSEAFQEIEVLRVIRAYENGISLDIHCAPEGDWTRLPKESFTKGCKIRVNPNDVLTAGSPSISSFISYLEPFLIPAELENILESSDVVGNIRFSRPTLYVFPGGQGDAALFGINGFNMLLDGGFSRKACFWDFVRHLDRLDAVLLTRLNNSNVNGISAVLRRKMQNAVYPQIGHFFCNIQERKAILSPDGDKDKDPLLINLLDEGQEVVSNLRHLSLTPQVCYRDSEPINLYHKVGHGTLDMYVLSPAKESKEVREFLLKWNNNDQKLFANPKTNKDFVFPLQNLVSICALLVWQPANPEDTITRILFPGSSPQNKIFEGLDKVKNLEFIKHPVCSEKSLAPTTIIKTKQSVLDRIIQPDKKIGVDNKKEKSEKTQKLPSNITEMEIKNGEMNGIQPSEKSAPVKKSDSTESEKSISKQRKIIENGEQKDKFKPKSKAEMKVKPRSESQQRKVKSNDKKPSPTTPKKQVEKINEEQLKAKAKISPASTPAKSAKEANNRKVVESKIKAAPKKEPPKHVSAEKKEIKTERKPISRRPKDISKLSGSPSKKVDGVQKPDGVSRRGKLDKEGTTDSSTVSTPSADQDSILKKDISKLTSDELQNLKAQELADLKEEQEAVKEIEAVFRKGELQDDKPSDFRKVKDLSLDDKLESEEYLIIEKTEIEQDLINEINQEEETQKIARDSEESEKQRKLSEEKEIEGKRTELKDEVQKIITSASDIIKAKEETVEASKEVSVTSPEDKIDLSTDKKDIENEIKETAQESQPDEKGSANIESGATTTAPTLPEDERMPLDEIKEDNGDQIIEEKHVKEDTKEKDVPVIQLPPKTFDNVTKLPSVVGIRLDKQSHIRDIVKTPDEVADLPVHEEVEFDHYEEYPNSTEVKSEVDEMRKSDTAKIGVKDKGTQQKETVDNKQVGESQGKKFAAEDNKTLINEPKEKDILVATEKEKLDEEKTELDLRKEEINLSVTKDKIPDTKEMISVENIEKKAEIENIEKQVDMGNVEKEAESVITQDSNRKEITKSELPDEEKDKDEHETDHVESTRGTKIVKEEDKTSFEIQEPPCIEKESEAILYNGEKDRTADPIKAEELVEKSETEVEEKQKLTQVESPKEKEIAEEPAETEATTVKKDEKQKLKEDVITIHTIDEKLQKLKGEIEEVEPIDPKQISTEAIHSEKEPIKIKEDVDTIEKIDEKLRKLKEETKDEQIKAVEEVVTHKTEEPQHAEPVIISSDSPLESPAGDEKKFGEKLALGQKSPKEREQDVAKIVASVAEVLKSDAPLEEFEGKIPFNIPYTTYTTELRETHITTVDSPTNEEKKTITTVSPKTSSSYFIEEERKIAPIHEEQEVPENKISKMIKDSNELMEATSKIIQDIKQSQPKSDEEITKEDQDGDSGTVHRMLVTASSEDGGEETEICPPGTITFSKSSESSGRSSPDLQSQKLSQKSSITDTVSDVTIITKSAIPTTEKVPEDLIQEDQLVCDTKKDSKSEKQFVDDIDRNVDETKQVGESLQTTKEGEKHVATVDDIEKHAVESGDLDKIAKDDMKDLHKTQEDGDIKETKSPQEEPSKKDEKPSIEQEKTISKDGITPEELTEEILKISKENQSPRKFEEKTIFEESTEKRSKESVSPDEKEEFKESTVTEIDDSLETTTQRNRKHDEASNQSSKTEQGIQEKIEPSSTTDKETTSTESTERVPEESMVSIKSEEFKDNILTQRKDISDVAVGFTTEDEAVHDKTDKIEHETQKKPEVTISDDKKSEDAVKFTEKSPEESATVLETEKSNAVSLSESKNVLTETTKISDEGKTLGDVTEDGEQETQKTSIPTLTEDRKDTECTKKTSEESMISLKTEKSPEGTITVDDLSLNKLNEFSQEVKTHEEGTEELKEVTQKTLEPTSTSEKKKDLNEEPTTLPETKLEVESEKPTAPFKETAKSDDTETSIKTVEKPLEEKKTHVQEIASDVSARIMHDTTGTIETTQNELKDVSDSVESTSEDMIKQQSKKAETVISATEDLKDGVIVTTQQTTVEQLQTGIDEQEAEVPAKKEKLAELMNFKEDLKNEVNDDIEKGESDIQLGKESIDTKMKNVEASLSDLQENVSSIADDAYIKTDETEEQIENAKHKTKEYVKEVCEKVPAEVSHKLEEKEKVVEGDAGEVGKKVKTEQVETKTEKIHDELNSAEKKKTEEEEKAEHDLEEKKEEVVTELHSLKDSSTEVKSDSSGTVENAVSDTPHEEKIHSPKTVQEADEKIKYDLYNGLEKVEKMVVDVLTADRETSDKLAKESPSVIQKVEKEVENIIQKGVEDVKELIEETKETVSSVFKHESDKEKLLEKTAQDIEKNFEIMSDMTKSVVFETCSKAEDDHKKQEEVLEKTTHNIEETYEAVAEMAKSALFEKCDKSADDFKKEVSEKATHDIEESNEDISEMAKSLVFEKSDKTTDSKKQEDVLEKTTHDIEETYETITEMAKSVVFEKCDKTAEDHKQQEVSEKTLENLEKETETCTDMSKSVSAEGADTKQLKSDEKLEYTDSTVESSQLSTDNETPDKIVRDLDTSAATVQKSSPTKEILAQDKECDLLKASHVHQDKVSDDSKTSLSHHEEASPAKQEKNKTTLDTDQNLSLSGSGSSPGSSGKISPPPSEHSTKKESLSEPTSPALSSDKNIDKEEKQKTTNDLSEKSSPFESGKSSPIRLDKCKDTDQSYAGTTDKYEEEAKKKSADEGSEESLEPDIQKSSEKSLECEKTQEKVSEKEDVKSLQSHQKEDPTKKDTKERIDQVCVSETTKTQSSELLKDDIEQEALHKKTSDNEDYEKKSIFDDKETVKPQLPEKNGEYASNISKSDIQKDTKQLDDKSEINVDSIDSGIETETDSKIKETEEPKIPVSEKDSMKEEQVLKVSETKEDCIAGPSTTSHDTSLSPAKNSTEDLHLSGKSTPDIAEVEKMKEIQETSKHEKHIVGSSTPPTVPVSPIVKEVSSAHAEDVKTTTVKSSTLSSVKDSEVRSNTPGSDDYEIGVSTHSDISSGQVSRAPHLLESERIESDEDDDVPGSPMSVTSQVAHSRSSSRYDFDEERIGTKHDPMNTSFYGTLPGEGDPEPDFEKAVAEHRETRGENLVSGEKEFPSYLYEITKAKYSSSSLGSEQENVQSGQTRLDEINKNGADNVMTASFVSDAPSTDTKKDAIDSWGKPFGLPSPAPPNDNRGTPKKERKLPSNVSAKNKLNDDKKRAESPSKYKNKKLNPIYVDLTYVPHHGNSYYSYVDFFKRIRARYYVFSGIEPSREVYNALLEAKQSWEDKELEVTIIPTYDTDILGYWVAENEELLTKYKIDLSPSASRCTINLQDHETSCSAYRLEF